MSDLEDVLLAEIRWKKLPEPTQEVAFALKKRGRRWRFDLAWPDVKLACEVEGGTWVAGRPNRGSGFEKDCEKYNTAVIDGWRVLRVTGNMVHDGSAIAFIEAALQAPITPWKE